MDEKSDLHKKMLESIIMKRKMRMDKLEIEDQKFRGNGEMNPNIGNQSQLNAPLWFYPNVMSPSQQAFPYHPVRVNDFAGVGYPNRNIPGMMPNAFPNAPVYSYDRPPVNYQGVYFIPSNQASMPGRNSKMSPPRNSPENTVHPVGVGSPYVPPPYIVTPPNFERNQTTERNPVIGKSFDRKVGQEEERWISSKQMNLLREEEKEDFMKYHMKKRNFSQRSPTNDSNINADKSLEERTEQFFDHILNDEFDEEEEDKTIPSERLFDKLLENAHGTESSEYTGENEEVSSSSDDEDEVFVLKRKILKKKKKKRKLKKHRKSERRKKVISSPPSKRKKKNNKKKQKRRKEVISKRSRNSRRRRRKNNSESESDDNDDSSFSEEAVEEEKNCKSEEEISSPPATKEVVMIEVEEEKVEVNGAGEPEKMKIEVPNPKIFCESFSQTNPYPALKELLGISTQTTKPYPKELPEKILSETMVQTDPVENACDSDDESPLNQLRKRRKSGRFNLFGKRKNKGKLKLKNVEQNTPIEWWEEFSSRVRRRKGEGQAEVGVQAQAHQAQTRSSLRIVTFPVLSFPPKESKEIEIQCQIIDVIEDQDDVDSPVSGYDTPVTDLSDYELDTPIPYTPTESDYSDSPKGGRKGHKKTKKRFSKIEVGEEIEEVEGEEEEEDVKTPRKKQPSEDIFEPKKKPNLTETEEDLSSSESSSSEEESSSEVKKYLSSKNEIFPDFRPKSTEHLKLKKKVLLFHYSRTFDVVDEKTRVLRKSFRLECYNSSEVKQFYALCTRNQYTKDADSKILINTMTTDEEITKVLSDGQFFYRNNSRGKIAKRWFTYIPEFEIVAWVARPDQTKKINGKNKRNRGKSLRFQQLQCVRYFELPNSIMRKYGSKKDFENRPHFVISLQTLVKGGKKKMFLELVHDERKIANMWFCAFVYMMLKASRGKIKL